MRPAATLARTQAAVSWLILTALSKTSGPKPLWFGPFSLFFRTCCRGPTLGRAALRSILLSTMSVRSFPLLIVGLPRLDRAQPFIASLSSNTVECGVAFGRGRQIRRSAGFVIPIVRGNNEESESFLGTALLGLLFVGVAAADTLELKDGRVLKGKISRRHASRAALRDKCEVRRLTQRTLSL